MKLDKIGPNTKVVPTPNTTAEKDLEPLAFSSHSLSTNNIYKLVLCYVIGSTTDSHDSLTIHYPR